MGFNKFISIAVLLVSLCFVVFSLLIFSVGNKYHVQVDTEYEEMFIEYQSFESSFNTTQEIIKGGDVNPAGQDMAVYPNTIAAGKQIMTSGNLFTKFIYNIPKIISVPTAVITILVLLVFVLAVYGFIQYIGKETP